METDGLDFGVLLGRMNGGEEETGSNGWELGGSGEGYGLGEPREGVSDTVSYV